MTDIVADLVQRLERAETIIRLSANYYGKEREEAFRAEVFCGCGEEGNPLMGHLRVEVVNGDILRDAAVETSDDPAEWPKIVQRRVDSWRLVHELWQQPSSEIYKIMYGESRFLLRARTEMEILLLLTRLQGITMTFATTSKDTDARAFLQSASNRLGGVIRQAQRERNQIITKL